MIQINKQGNAIVIEFTDNDKYLFDGTIEVAPNELMVVIDESDMATFKRTSNGDVLFSQIIDNIQISGTSVTKDNIIEQFGIIGYTSGGGGGTGAVSSVNGQTGDVVLTAGSLNAYTKQEVNSLVTAENVEREKQDSALGAMIAAETAAREQAVATKQDILVSGTNIKTINNQSLLGSGNIEIEGGGTITVDSELSTTSENPVQNKVITTAINNKQDAGDYALKSELPDTAELATKEELAAKLDTSTYNEEKANFALKSELPDTSNLALKSEVTSGLATKLDVTTYNADKPTFALKTEIPDVSGLATKTELAGKLDTATYNSEKASFETKENAAATYQVKGDYATTAQLNGKQDALVSGTNIKTINGNSILGEGDLEISGGGETKVWDYNEVNSSPSDFYNNAKAGDLLNNYTTSRAIATYAPAVITSVKSETGDDSKAYSLLFANEENPFILNLIVLSNSIESRTEFSIVDPTTKQDKLISGTNIKTVNGESLLGAGDIVIQGGGGIADAPADNKKYVRSNNAWVEEVDISGLATKAELADKLDVSTYNVDKETFETKENASATYATKAELGDINTILDSINGEVI